MTRDTPRTITTTLTLPVDIRARLDELKAQRARTSGRWPSSNAIVLEALQALLEREFHPAS
ncbi:hypothetical protein F0U62_17410 [Cystobacter fuscus]|jgi:predicted transcriptional regulator|uniref:hypothetical protein n=1 Tax=Cystobacter fuscus TaxID=43 RepID=UPI002B2D7142|nr:hypothetical protein F0U62_17410 [Cystobacter fuscus]